MASVVDRCPVCGSGVKPHCPETNRSCKWQQCTRRACFAVVDAARRRGFIMVGSLAKQIAWPA